MHTMIDGIPVWGEHDQEERVQKHSRIVGLRVIVVVILLAVGCDQGTKALARSCLGKGDVVSLLGGALIVRYVENQGAFLSLGAWLPEPVRRALFIAFPAAILGGLIAYVARKKDIRLLLGAGFSCA